MHTPSQVPNQLKLTGKVAVITGGTTGIGRASAELFRQHGARVAITGAHAERVEQARAELGADVLVLRADARSHTDAEALATTIASQHDGVDVLFLNAGIARIAAFDALDVAAYEAEMDTNVRGALFTLRALLPRLRSGASVIVNTSLAALRGAAYMSVYSASKGALSSLVRALAVELAPRGIRVNAIAPGCIHTPIQAKFGLPAEVAEASQRAFTERIPLRRFGVAEEVARAALFLASDDASFITGIELPVDGGLSASC